MQWADSHCVAVSVFQSVQTDVTSKVTYSCETDTQARKTVNHSAPLERKEHPPRGKQAHEATR